MPRVRNMKTGAHGFGSKSDIESDDARASGELHSCVDDLRLELQAQVMPPVRVHVRVVEAHVGNDQRPRACGDLWLQWLVAVGSRKPVAAIACGLWS